MRHLATAVTIVLTTIFVALAAGSSEARAQMAWDYVELLHASSSAEDHSRWQDVGTGGCSPATDPAAACLAIQLPKDLVGDRDVAVVLRGPAVARGEFNTLVGDGAEASCVATATSRSCLVRFPALDVDAGAVDAFLATVYAPGAALTLARHRAREFAATPVLRYWHGIN